MKRIEGDDLEVFVASCSIKKTTPFEILENGHIGFGKGNTKFCMCD